MTATKGELTRAKIITKAKALIGKQGFNNTSISNIINATGVKKGNLYFHFPSKEALGHAILEQTRQEAADFLTSALTGSSPGEKLSNYLDNVFEKHKQVNFVGGCLIGNTAIEMGDTNPAFSLIVGTIFDHWKQTLADLIRQACETGEIKLDMDPEHLALHMVAVIEGGIMMSKVSKNGNDLRQSLTSLRLIMGISDTPVATETHN